MDSKHHCNDCPYWYVTKKKYPSGFYNILLGKVGTDMSLTKRGFRMR